MEDISKYPPELLLQPASERVKYFKDHFAQHDKLNQVLDMLIDAICDRYPLIFLLGPPGVGKTTLLSKLNGRIAGEKLLRGIGGEDLINIFFIELIAQGTRIFNFSDFYRRSLFGLHKQFPQYRVDFEDGRKIHYDPQGQLVIAGDSSEAVLRRAFEQYLRVVKLAAFVMDEAPHLMTLASGVQFEALMDVIKSWASLCDTPFVLAGVYELHQLIDRNAQLGRRNTVVHFERYKTTPKDLKDFQNVIQSFNVRLPLEKQPALLDYWEELYVQSLGCAGMLKDWLTHALRAALLTEEKILTKEHLDACAQPTAKLFNMLQSINEGETELEKHIGKRDDELSELIGSKLLKENTPPPQNKTPAPENKTPTPENTPSPENKTPTPEKETPTTQNNTQDLQTKKNSSRGNTKKGNSKKGTKKTRPFRRKLGRDSTGLEAYGFGGNISDNE